MSRRWRDPLVSRRRRLETPWAPPAAPAPPTLPPPMLAAERRRVMPVRHAHSFSPPVSTAVAPASLVRRGRVVMSARRGQFIDGQFPAPVAAGPGPLVPSPLRQSRRPNVMLRRGQFEDLTWPQQTPDSPPVIVPALLRQSARRLAAIRRGKFQLVPGVGAVVSP